MKKLGIDLGSSSIGWAITEDDKIYKHGVIIFEAGMNKGNSGAYSSPTKDRREARSKRRLIQARKYRKWELLKLLIEYHMVPLNSAELDKWSKYRKGVQRKFPENKQFLQWLACDFRYLENGINYKNPYELRVKSLDKQVTSHEFGRALYHIVQRRGYKNIGETDKETKTQIERRNTTGFDKAMQENRTIAEALKNNFLDQGIRARNLYPYREEYQNELEAICKRQGYDISKSNSNEYNNKFVQSAYKAIIWQRPLRSQKGNIGKCTLEPNKSRCPASHPIFEIFRAWSFINTIKTIEENNKKEFIPQEYRMNLFNNLFLTKNKNFKFEEIKKFLDKQFGQNKSYNYPINYKTGKYDTTVSGMPVCNGFIKIFGDEIKSEIHKMHQYNIGTAPKTINGYSLYDLWHILFNCDEKYIHNFAIEKLKIKDDEKIIKDKKILVNKFSNLKKVMPAGYADLSLKVMRRIIPILMDGFLYNDAVLLAKMPDLLNEDWEPKKNLIYSLLNKSKEQYNWIKTTTIIANNLINTHKGLPENEKFAYKTFDYKLEESDFNDVRNACADHFGIKTWTEIDDKSQIINKVADLYQDYFYDEKREYREIPLLNDLFKELLKKNEIDLKGELYHHSMTENIYGECVDYIDKETGAIKRILPVPLIDSIKNPMFNKAMSVLRRLVNNLIIKNEIDDDTEVIVEVASELNDNNKRAAIERYQKEREAKRNKYREFLKQYKEEENAALNVEENVLKFELWSEQIFRSDNIQKEKNKSINDVILGQKDAIKRYELWIEQKGQCMYTGRMISISQLFSNEIDIEHTIPRSILPDNTMANQTVCFSKYNSDIKNNRFPTQCPNFKVDKDVGTAIEPRLEKWIMIRDNYRDLFEKNKRPRGVEDEEVKNRRIQSKHYYKMHFDYWRDKIERFTANEVKDSWARRQLVDTQMVSKYAREFLKVYFKKVFVQKGSITADFRKIYGFQAEQEIKSRNKHTHHAIDAAVLTLIPTNSSYRDRLLKKMYEMSEKRQGQFTCKPLYFENFSSQKIIEQIENNTLVVNYVKNKILQQTYRNVRKRGRIQYLKRNGKFVLDKNGEKIKLNSAGDTIRKSLYKDSFIAKIKNVKRDPETGKPLRNKDGSWQFQTGKEEFEWVRRKKIEEINRIEDIVDPSIRKIVQKNSTDSVDLQGNKIRHVRVKVKAGREVKERLNYLSKHDYKNKYYSESDSIPYGILLEGFGIERKLIPVPSFEVAMVFKKHKKFNPDLYLKMFHKDFQDYNSSKLLYVGQKVLVLNNDDEINLIKKNKFQINRLYKITQFFVDGSGGIYLKHHLEATKDEDIDSLVKEKKHLFLKNNYDDLFGLEEVKEDLSIEDVNKRKKKFVDEKYKFVGLNDNRLARLLPYLDKEKIKEIKKDLDRIKKQSSKIELERETPLLKISAKNINFIYEGYDFEISILGVMKWLNNDLSFSK